MVSLSEQLNGARIRLEQAQAAIADSERRTAEAQAATDKIRDQLNARAAEIYKGAGTSNPLDAVDVNNVTELAARSKYASAAADNDDSLLAKLQQAREILAVQKAQLETQQAAATSPSATPPTGPAPSSQATTAQRTALLSQVKGQLKTLVDQEARPPGERQPARGPGRRPAGSPPAAAEQRRAVRSRRTSRTPPPRTAARPPRWPSPRPRSARATVYATSGPDTFDCSGLTAAAWAAAGVGLAHYSGAQYQQTIRIGPGDLQPGDLVFYGPGGSNHVEIYIGGGMVVSASNPADRA